MPKKKKSNDISLERETRVLLEEIRSDVKKVAEGHSAIASKLEEHDKRFDQIDGRFNMIEAAVSDNGRSLKQVNEKISTVTQDHERRIKKLEAVS